MEQKIDEFQKEQRASAQIKVKNYAPRTLLKSAIEAMIDSGTLDRMTQNRSLQKTSGLFNRVQRPADDPPRNALHRAADWDVLDEEALRDSRLCDELRHLMEES